MITLGKSLRLLVLNKQHYSHSAWFIARAVDGDCLGAAVLWSQSRKQKADLKTAAMFEVSKLLSF